jgi:hypothetical protein
VTGRVEVATRALGHAAASDPNASLDLVSAMASEQATSYLDKQLAIEKNIVSTVLFLRVRSERGCRLPTAPSAARSQCM